jgi:ACS family glucarate transporter-like MFS transporter
MSTVPTPTSASPSRIAHPDKPTRARSKVIVFASALGVLAYFDKVLMSQAAGDISKDLHLNRATMGLIFSAFALSYALFEVPSGWLGDKLGPRRVLVRIVLSWSAFTALTGAAWNFASLWTVQFLFGAGESGCFPNLTKALSAWLPIKERARAQGIMWACARWGGALTPPLAVIAIGALGWRLAFPAFGSLGVVWCVFFYRWFRDRPADHPSVGRAELQQLEGLGVNSGGHGDVPWSKLISRGSMWLLWLQYFCFSFGWYFYITWLPTYLRDYRGLPSGQAARLAVLPLLFGGFGSLLSGILTARLAHRSRNIRAMRKSIACFGFVASAFFTWLVTRTGDPLPAMIAMALASFSTDLSMPIAWNACMDIGGKYAGTVAGSMNMLGNLGGFAAGAFDGFLLQRTHDNWNLLLTTVSCVYLVAAVAWIAIDPVTPLEQET